jgi:hypothetical protein
MITKREELLESFLQKQTTVIDVQNKFKEIKQTERNLVNDIKSITYFKMKIVNE